MGKWLHRLVWVDPVELVGQCSTCGTVAVRPKKKPDGSLRYNCRTAERAYTNTPAAKARKQRWRASNPEQAREHESTRRRKGLSQAPHRSVRALRLQTHVPLAA